MRLSTAGSAKSQHRKSAMSCEDYKAQLRVLQVELAERGGWYVQRYVARLPVEVELVLFNRSWYNRAGVEHVMGFRSKEEPEELMLSVPKFEEMLVNSGTKLLKYYLDIDKAEQKRRLAKRQRDPLKQWKTSPVDDVAVNYVAGNATVRYDETRLKIAEIKARVHQCDYRCAGASHAARLGVRKPWRKHEAVAHPATPMKSDPYDIVAAIELSHATLRKMHQNLLWAVGYNAIALSLAAGVFYPFTLSPEIAALSMSGSSAIVAINGLTLKRAKLAGIHQPAE